MKTIHAAPCRSWSPHHPRSLLAFAGLTVLAAIPIVAAGTPAALASTRPPPIARMLQRSRQVMQSLRRVHTTGSNSLWSSGTNGNHIPSSFGLQIAGDCVKSDNGSRFTVGTRLRVIGEHRVGGRRQEAIDQRYIVIVSGRTNATSSAGQSVHAWERDARTHHRWTTAPIETLVQRPAYFLGNMGICPNPGALLAIPANRFALAGTTTVHGMAVWHLSGTRILSDTTRLDLYVDQVTYRWARVASTFIIRNKGTVVNRISSVSDYSAFNAPVAINPPVIGSMQSPP